MQNIFSRWLNNVYLRRPATRNRMQPTTDRLEALEHRLLLHATIGPFLGSPEGVYNVGSGNDLFVPVQFTDEDSDDTGAVTFSVSDDNANVTSEILSGGRSLRMTVSGVNAAGDPFSGTMTFRLFENSAPDTTARIIQLVEQGFYDENPTTSANEMIFHRIINGFVAQTGDPTGTGGGGSGVDFDDEYDPAITFSSPGLLAMANSGDDTNDSQFFIVDTDRALSQLPTHLNFNHTIFGVLTSGFDTFQNVINTPTTTGDRPVTPVVVGNVDVFTDTRNGVVRVTEPLGFTGTANVTVTVAAGSGSAQQAFTVNVTPDTLNDLPFLGDVTNRTTNEDTPVTFTVQGFDIDNELATFQRTPTHTPTTHIHAGLTIVLDGTPVTILANAGNPAIAHTHASDNQLHIHPAVDNGFVTLGDWFDVWRTSTTAPGHNANANFTTTQLMDRVVNATSDIRMTVNGIPYVPNPDYIVHDGDVIRLSYESRTTNDLTFVVRDPTTFAEVTNVTASVQVVDTTATITLTPGPDFSGTRNLLIGVNDGPATEGRSNFDTQPITLTVTAQNDAPVTAPASLTTPVVQPLSVQLSGNDGDDDLTQVITFAIVDQPQNGTISGLNPATGALVYTPAAGFSGTVTFTYQVTDDGGTANGGDDSSDPTTITVRVGDLPPPAPTALDLTTDDGLFTDDNFTSNAEPRITLTATTGSTVQLLVNGTTTVAATETTAGSGSFAATLSRSALRVGENTVTATASNATGPSSPSSEFRFTYAPSYSNLYTVPGAPGSAQSVSIEFSRREAQNDNELGIFTVDDLEGRVDGLSPSAPGYAAAALNRASRETVFASGQGTGAASTQSLTGGDLVGFYLISNSTTAKFLAKNPTNDRNEGPLAFFSFTAANPDGLQHMRTVQDPVTGRVLLHWEDLLGGGDRDFNDAVIAVVPAADAAIDVGEALRTPGGAGRTLAATQTTFTLQRPRNRASGRVLGELGFFVVENASGSVNGVQPGAPGYLAAALQSSSRQVLFNRGADILDTESATLSLPSGVLIGFYYTPEATAASVVANNPTNNPAVGPVAFFSFDAANPNGIEHFRWFGPEQNEGEVVPASEGGTQDFSLHVTDDVFGNSSSFDDLLISIDLP